MNLNSDLINDKTVHELVTKIGSCTIVMYTYYSNYMNYSNHFNFDYGNCISNPSRTTVSDKYVNATEDTMAHKYLCATMEGHIVETIQQENEEP